MIKMNNLLAQGITTQCKHRLSESCEGCGHRMLHQVNLECFEQCQHNNNEFARCWVTSMYKTDGNGYAVGQPNFLIKGRTLIPIKSFTVILLLDGVFYKFVVPKGFKSDGASIPRIFWNILPPFGNYNRAAVVHDYLHRVKDDVTQYIGRYLTDSLFYYLMRDDRVPNYRATYMYYGVRSGGSFSWRERNKEYEDRTTKLRL